MRKSGSAALAIRDTFAPGMIAGLSTSRAGEYPTYKKPTGKLIDHKSKWHNCILCSVKIRIAYLRRIRHLMIKMKSYPKMISANYGTSSIEARRRLLFTQWRCAFRNDDPQRVQDELACYHNDDAGFGYALEANCMNPNSSPYITGFAINMIESFPNAFPGSNHPSRGGF